MKLAISESPSRLLNFSRVQPARRSEARLYILVRIVIITVALRAALVPPPVSGPVASTNIQYVP
jgi:hypothetical protein